MNFKYIFLFIFFFCIKSQYAFSIGDKFELNSADAVLFINSKGNIEIKYDKNQRIKINTSIHELCKFSVFNKTTKKSYNFQFDGNQKIIKENNRLLIVNDNFRLKDQTLPINVELVISVNNDAFCFSGHFKSSSDEWLFKTLNYPIISAIQIGKDAGIYWPNGLGEYFPEPKYFNCKNLQFPSHGASMPWFTINSGELGFYVGCHDSVESVNLKLEYIEKDHSFKTGITNTFYKSEFASPEIRIMPYGGGWYQAAKYYRTWYDENHEVVEPPEWVISDSGWLLAIMKQQNGNLMWPYDQIDELCNIALQHNIKTLGLFGWAIGGHDRLYPNYVPDNLMGGREKLIQAIERAHKKGLKVILYANGRLIDSSTDYYLFNGLETIILDQKLSPDIQFYRKHKDSTPVIFATACIGSEVWRKTMLELAIQAQSLGADGILYDQIGGSFSQLCFSNHHDHEPGENDLKYRLQMLREIRQKMKKTNPGFIIMTEGTNDIITKEIDYTHGLGMGFAPSKNCFPELYRYTFPELIMTQRNTNPMVTRFDANFAAIYGLRHEIECRYSADKEYILNGEIPNKEDYSNINSKPDISKINQVSTKAATEYLYKLIQFENDHAEFLRYGKFVDQEGIEIYGDNIKAKGFLNANRLGVLVWNQNLTEKESFDIKIANYQLTEVHDPLLGIFEADSPLEKNSVRLLVYEKN